MPFADISSTRSRLRQLLISDAFVRASDNTRIISWGYIDTTNWLFDVKNILMQSSAMIDIAALFWEHYSGKSEFQLCGIESAGIPLATALTLTGAEQYGRTGMSGFYIRKSRKKEGLTKFVEGSMHPNVPIVLVDDVINRGTTAKRLIEVLQNHGGNVTDLWTIIRFRDLEYYETLREQGISIHSIFELKDFPELDLKNLPEDTLWRRSRSPFKKIWKFSSPNPSHHFIAPKSDPVADDTCVYVGSDTGVMRALDQIDGHVVWSFKSGSHVMGKGIFSSPALHDGKIFFGAYDGNIYSLDAATGKKIWVSFDADWVGSSPAIASDLGLLFIGTEFGLWRKRGGILALDLKSGKKIWSYSEMPNYTHSSPLFIAAHRQVVIGSNDGAAYLFDAISGGLLWKFQPIVPDDGELTTGFSSHDIKESFAYDSLRDRIIYGTMNGDIYIVDRKKGVQVGHFKAEFGIYSTPVIYGDTVLVSSVDKHLYCLSLDTFQLKWKWHAGARIFATPVIIQGSVYIGSNTGELTELDPETGLPLSYAVVGERVTNRVVYSSSTESFFVPTVANEIYCLKKDTFR